MRVLIGRQCMRKGGNVGRTHHSSTVRPGKLALIPTTKNSARGTNARTDTLICTRTVARVRVSMHKQAQRHVGLKRWHPVFAE